MPDYGQSVPKVSAHHSHGGQDNKQHSQTTTQHRPHPGAHALPRHVKSLADKGKIIFELKAYRRHLRCIIRIFHMVTDTHCVTQTNTQTCNSHSLL